MIIQIKSTTFMKLTLDIISLAGGYYFSGMIMPDSYRLMFLTVSHGFELIVLIQVLVWINTKELFGLYDGYNINTQGKEILASVKMLNLQLLVFMLSQVLLTNRVMWDISVLVYIVSLSMLIIQKSVVRRLYLLAKTYPRTASRILFLGVNNQTNSIHNLINTSPFLSHTVVGFLEDRPHAGLNGNYLGKIDYLSEVLDRHKIDDVLISLNETVIPRLNEIIATCNRFTTRVKILPDRIINNYFTAESFNLGHHYLLSLRREKVNELPWRFFKRMFDIVFSLMVFLFVFSWLWPLIIVCIKMDSSGPVFFKQERWGKDNRKISFYKFRSMYYNSDQTDNAGKYRQARKNDERITRVGKILRKTSLDELPQFINVLKGDMTIVGPRPHPAKLNYEAMQYTDCYMLRHLVKPGITGWAQINGARGETDNCLMQKRIQLDLWYIENWSFTLDMKIILLTVLKLFQNDPNVY